MKIHVFISIFLMIFMLALSAFGQTISWEIKLHNSENLNILKQEVTAYINNGYVPLGITYDDAELYILYVHDPDFGVQAWSLEWYDNRNDVQTGITTNMNQGYIPIGITYTGESFYVLYIQISSSASAWQLIPSGTNLSSVQRAIQPYLDQAYLPVGITSLDDEYWVLLLLIPDTTSDYWRLETYEVGTHSDAVNRNIEQGYIPWGVMYNANAQEIDILYVGF